MHKQEMVKGVQWCVNSYRGKHGKEDWSLLKNIIPFKFKNTDGYIAEYYSSLVICFRGSKGDADWDDNFRFVQKTWDDVDPKVKIHAGFASQYRDVMNYVKEIVPKYYEIYVVGHSLGGALATLCSYHIKKEMPDRNVVAITFGSPRVGNPEFVKRYNRMLSNNSARLVYREDIVCKVPWKITDPCSMFTYRHVKNKVQLGKRRGLIKRIVGVKDDHYPEKYLDSLLSM